jgi:hypothetical protein
LPSTQSGHTLAVAEGTPPLMQEQSAYDIIGIGRLRARKHPWLDDATEGACHDRS